MNFFRKKRSALKLFGVAGKKRMPIPNRVRLISASDATGGKNELSRTYLCFCASFSFTFFFYGPRINFSTKWICRCCLCGVCIELSLTPVSHPIFLCLSRLHFDYYYDLCDGHRMCDFLPRKNKCLRHGRASGTGETRPSG